jgi:uncharacterized protein (TIGR03083 family)
MAESNNVWSTIHAERSALADDLASLPEEQWRTPSLCTDWTVRDVLAHLTSTAKMTPPSFFAKFAGSGFRFGTMTAKEIARESAGTPADGLAEFRRVLDRTSSPPGPVDSWLGEVVLHSEDIRRPLAIQHTYPAVALVRLANFYKGSNLLIGAKDRIAGLTLTATDADWSTGSGPEVKGPLLALLLAMTGRSAALGDLSGEGLATLSSRMT